jgi:hypothetical protein
MKESRMKAEQPGWLDRLTTHTRALTAIVLALTAACAVVYLAIGLGFIYEQPKDGVPLAVFGFSAAAAFALGVVLMVVRPGRNVWILGAAFMAFVIVAYVNVAPKRNPSFEIWGISLKIAQAFILAALLGLLARDRRTSRAR